MCVCVCVFMHVDMCCVGVWVWVGMGVGYCRDMISVVIILRDFPSGVCPSCVQF